MNAHEHVVTVKFTYFEAKAGSRIVCPNCGQPPIAVEQTFVASCSIFKYKRPPCDGVSWGYQETDTDVLWNSSKEVSVNGLPLLVCMSGDYFTHPDMDATKIG